MVLLDLGGLTIGMFVGGVHHERRIQGNPDLSVLTWTRDERGNIIGTSDGLSREDGELHLRLLSDSDSNVAGQAVEVAVKHSEILNAIRIAGRYTPLGGVPRGNDPLTLHSSVAPFPSFHRCVFAPHSNVNIAAHTARLLHLGDRPLPSLPCWAVARVPVCFTPSHMRRTGREL